MINLLFSNIVAMNAPHIPEGMEVSEECTRFWNGYYQCISRIGSTFQPTTLSQGQQEAFGIIEKIIGATYLQELLEQNITKNDRGHLETPKELREIFDTASKLAHSIHSQDDVNKTRKILFELMQFATNIAGMNFTEIKNAFTTSPLSSEEKATILEEYLRTGEIPNSGKNPIKKLFAESIKKAFENMDHATVIRTIGDNLKQIEALLQKSSR